MNALSHSVPSLFLPLSSGALLLPNVCVAEVVLAKQLSTAISSPFLLGMFNWRDQEVPVIAFEGLRDGEQPADLEMRQLAIINGLSQPEVLPFYAIVLSSVPHVAHLASVDLQPAEGELPPACHSRITVEGKEAIIPDCDALEAALIEALA